MNQCNRSPKTLALLTPFILLASLPSIAATTSPSTQPATAPASAPSASAPQINFFNSSASAQSAVYVCDASGSMLSKIGYVCSALDKSISNLNPQQSFDVIFFQGTSALSLDQSQLLPATPDHKKVAQDFIDGISPQGPTDPLPALQKAFALHPQVVFLLTDGDFPDNQAVINFVKQNANGIRVNTIALINRGVTYESALQQIATDSGGTFSIVSNDTLNK